jgi:hypothetical protein
MQEDTEEDTKGLQAELAIQMVMGICPGAVTLRR